VVIPPTDRIPLATLKKLDQWVTKGGGKAIAVGRAPTMDADGKTTPELANLLKMLPFVPDDENLARALKEETVPDLKLDNATADARNSIGFIRRAVAGADVYFVVNTSNRTIDTSAGFASTHKFAEEWDPDSGALSAASTSGQTIHLAPYESRVFVLSDAKPVGRPAPGASLARSRNDFGPNWKVTFPGLNKTLSESTLADWTVDPSTRNYSGEAVYSQDFLYAPKMNGNPVYLQVEGGTALPGAPNSPPDHGPVPGVLGPNGIPDPRITRTGPGMHAYYDPPIREAAIVFINGQEAGALWHPPYRLDVSKLLKTGTNQIEIHVYNTALNAWSALPRHDYKPLIDKYGDRFQMQDLDLVKPIPSGILGTINLVTAGPQ
jgi:hypothetical protein